MGLEFYYTVILIIGLIVWWFLENSRHKKNLKKVQYRIHVNGTRGKSSVTRLIAGIFREAGYKTIAKTTGSTPRIIFPDGHEEPIQRRGGANIREQVKILNLAANMGVEVAVLECMALQPQYQEITEKKMIKANAAVLTNTRPDHLDVMGPTPEDVVDALSGMIPENGLLFTSERENLKKLQANALKLGAEVLSSQDIIIDAKEIDRFSHIEHHDNVALSLKVANHFGIDREIAMRGMLKAKPDPGALMLYHMPSNNKDIVFANAFAANDPESNKLVWNIINNRFEKEKRFIILNNRADRQTRTIQLAEFVSHIEADHFFLIGTGTDILKGLLKKNGIGSMKFTDFSNRTCPEIFKEIEKKTENKSVVIGMGNIGGIGHDVIKYCEASLDHTKKGG
ncbi:MAG: poly-gamma-glutamate synthase PgsB [Candidatus Zixiibacteriota bacterium]